MRRTFSGAQVTLLAAMLVAVGCGAPDDPVLGRPAAQELSGATPGPTLSAGRSAWVSVSVATLWRDPTSPRPVDAPALAKPVHIQQWLSDMTLAQRRALSGRADTQALLGDRVRVVRLRAHWAKVVVPSQPSQLDDRGYPGWIPRRQLTARPPATSILGATVVARTAWLRTDQPVPVRLFRVSFATTLPVVERTDTYVRVVDPEGVVRRLRRAAVVLHRAGAPALTASPSSLVRASKRFLGLPYLWAGLSGFGVDCSGLIWLDYRVHGITIPRDALPQSRHGTPVSRPLSGDLLFYATAGRVHHVSMDIGGGMMIHAPGTGMPVQVVAISTWTGHREYVGARRYLP